MRAFRDPGRHLSTPHNTPLARPPRALQHRTEHASTGQRAAAAHDPHPGAARRVDLDHRPAGSRGLALQQVHLAWGRARLLLLQPTAVHRRVADAPVVEPLGLVAAGIVAAGRPGLDGAADPDFVSKAAEARADEINTCIGCNQACLDHTFSNQRASSLVNPRAGRETTLVLSPTRTRRTVAVVGAGPVGLATAVTAAERAHAVTVFEARPEIGGQFRLAMRIPAKEEFAETLRYYTSGTSPGSRRRAPRGYGGRSRRGSASGSRPTPPHRSVRRLVCGARNWLIR